MSQFKFPFSVLFIWFSFLTSFSVQAAESELTWTQVCQQTLRSTVLVFSPRADGVSQGTGWVLDQSRKLVITNHHVVGDKGTVAVMFPVFENGQLVADHDYYFKNMRNGNSDKVIGGKVIAVDAKSDLALIEVSTMPKDAKGLKIAVYPPKFLDKLYGVGNPDTRVWEFINGTVTELKSTLDLHHGLIQVATGTSGWKGASGGPLVNRHGELVGVICQQKPLEQTVLFGIDARQVLKFLAKSGQHRDLAAQLYNQSATYYNQQGQYDLALADYTEAIRLDPRVAAVYRSRATLWVRKGAYDQAIIDCRTAIYLNPKDAGAFNERGVAHSFKDDYDKAIADYTAAIQLDAAFALAYRNRGSSFYHKGDYDQAIRDCTTAIQLNPQDAKAHLRRSQAYAKKGENGKAQEDYQTAIRLDPSLKTSERTKR